VGCATGKAVFTTIHLFDFTTLAHRQAKLRMVQAAWAIENTVRHWHPRNQLGEDAHGYAAGATVFRCWLLLVAAFGFSTYVALQTVSIDPRWT